MTLLIEGPRSFSLGSRALLVEDGRELAWAERHVRKADDIGWILGNFVEADNPNGNGHVFPLEDLRQTYQGIENRPLNMLHAEHQIVGNFVGAELLEPGKEAAGANQVTTPHVETIAAFYRYYFPKLYDEVIVPAHKEGNLALSMECTPRSLTCLGKGEDPGCGREFAYHGRTHESYCDHLRQAGARKKLNMPHFTAGAIIVPPVKPGWRNANVHELSQLEAWINQNLQEAEMAYQQVADEFPHLEPAQWESMMTQLLAGAHIDINELTGKAGANQSAFPTGATPGVDMGRQPTALPDGTYTVINETTLRQAVALASQVGLFGPDEVARKHILRRADALGLMNHPPVAETLADWREAYPDWNRMDAALLASLGFGLDYERDYEIARDFNTAKRVALAKQGLAIPIKNDKGEIVGGRFPVVTVADLKNAIQAVGRGKGAAEVKTFIKKRAAALGATKMLGPAFAA